MTSSTNTGTLTAHVPTVLLRHLEVAPDEQVRSLDATVMFADVSGFTRLSERLARSGREGAERLTEAINSCFTALLADAYENGASLIKFGGDALLLWFDGEDHPARACTAAVAMRQTLREIVRSRTGADKVELRISIGIHSGIYETFLVGHSHREYLIAGPAASTAVAMEAVAATSQILVSPATAELLPSSCLGASTGPGVLISRSPLSAPQPRRKLPRAPLEVVAGCLSTEVRAHLLAAPAALEHRTATIAFLQFGKLDRVIAEQGAAPAAKQLDELVRHAQEAADRCEVCFLGSDVAVDGGKLLLTAGAPRAVGDDEERMLLTLRHVIDAQPALPIRAGVNRGHVFAGEVGPFYRRTYTVMGDAVNLAARLSAKAPWGSIYATPSVLDRSSTRFEREAVAPFVVKGKSRPVEVCRLGSIRRSRSPGSVRRQLPLIGRSREMEAITQAIADARGGSGKLVEIVGETGSGKSRLLAEARALAEEMQFIHTTCEAYTRGTPYVAWRDPMRELLGLTWEDPPEVVLTRLRAEIESTTPDLLPWLPLLGIVFNADAPATREVEELAPSARVAQLHRVVLRFLAPALAVPTLVQIEHTHLMDEASAALLRALAARLGSSSWMVIATRRDVDEGFVASGSEALKLELGPLSRADLRALAETTPESHAVAPHLLELAVERAGGSPEFLLDLLAAAADGVESLPKSVDAAAMARIDALAPTDRTLVRRAAVLGGSFHPRRLADVLDPEMARPDDRTWRRLESVFARDPDGHVRFKRPVLREVAYEGLPFRTRRALHRAIAEGLEQGLGSDVDADPAMLSLHFMLAGQPDPAYMYALLGAERATERFSHADAATLYRRAIEAGRNSKTPGQLAAAWEGLGEALRLTGQPRAATAALTEARRCSEKDPLTQARLFYRHAQVAQRSERLTAAVRWVRRGLRALEGLESEGATAQRARLYSTLANVRQRQGRPVQAAKLCRLAIAEAERVGELRALAHASYVLDEALFESGQVRPGEVPNSARALEIYARLGDPEQEHKVLNNMGGLAYFAGNWEEAAQLYRRAADRSERAGKPADTAYTDCNIAEILSDQGHLSEAEAHLKRARRVWSSTGDRQGVGYANILLGRLAVRDARHEEGLALLQSAEQELRSLRLDADAELAAMLSAEAEALSGDPKRALKLADGLLAGTDRSQALLHRARGMALVRLGLSAEAREALESAIAAAREHGIEYEIAADIALLGQLGSVEPELVRERDSILRRLRIEWLPLPELPAAAPVAMATG